MALAKTYFLHDSKQRLCNTSMLEYLCSKEDATMDKNTVYKYCLATVQSHIATARQAATDAQQSANDETKSTAGDKHDTARAMAHIEQEKYARILASHIENEKALVQLSKISKHDSITPGNLVTCSNDRYFYISIGLGVCSIDGKKVAVLSPQAPIAKLLIGKKKGQSVTFNGQTYCIERVS